MNLDVIRYSSSSDDELLMPNRQYRIRLDMFNHYSDSQFLTRFRFSKETVVFILDLLPNLEIINNRGKPLFEMDQVLIALRFYATGTFQNVVGDIIQVHKSTVCKVVRRMSHQLASLRPHFIKMPTNNDVFKTKNDFFKIRRFPNVIGCIDCTHVKIQSPGGQDAELYRNRKGYFSINVQAICNSQLLFNEITARWRGSVHDSTIFNCSQVRADLEEGLYPANSCYLLGDSGYPCKNYLLTPILNPVGEAERRYNVAHIQTRNTIERSFGVWKRRFPCLSLGLRTKIDTTLKIIVATAVLHNIAILQKEEPVMDDLEALEQFDQILIEGAQNQFAVRNNVIATIFRS